jgi:hypothetical protein
VGLSSPPSFDPASGSASLDRADAARSVDGEPSAPAEPSPRAVADDQDAPVLAPTYTSTCNEQAAQDFLVRGNILKGGHEGNARAIQYRTDHYGRFKSFGRPQPGALAPSAFAVDTTFMGLHVKLHRKVVPVLSCVEDEIKRACADSPYEPHALAGLRYRNTYRHGEVTNHVYGIAIDVDPKENSCCGCVKPWSEAEICKRPSKTEYDRMAMPECWVHAFERYGFYWLGHDELRDTMHFEFLGDPDKIARGADARDESSPVGGGTYRGR